MKSAEMEFWGSSSFLQMPSELGTIGSTALWKQLELTLGRSPLRSPGLALPIHKRSVTIPILSVFESRAGIDLAHGAQHAGLHASLVPFQRRYVLKTCQLMSHASAVPEEWTSVWIAHRLPPFDRVPPSLGLAREKLLCFMKPHPQRSTVVVVEYAHRKCPGL